MSFDRLFTHASYLLQCYPPFTRQYAMHRCGSVADREARRNVDANAVRHCLNPVFFFLPSFSRQPFKPDKKRNASVKYHGYDARPSSDFHVRSACAHNDDDDEEKTHCDERISSLRRFFSFSFFSSLLVSPGEIRAWVVCRHLFSRSHRTD